MYWPAPIAETFSGRGKFLTGGVSVVAAVFGVLVAKVTGIIILVGVVLVLLVVELWRDSERLTNDLETVTNDRRDARRDATVARGELDTAEQQLREMAVLEAKSASLMADNSVLRKELASRFRELPKLLAGLMDQVAVIQLVQRHRALAAGNAGRWSVVRVTPYDNRTAQVVSYAGPSCEYVAGEPVVIIDQSSDEVYGDGVAIIENQQLIVIISLAYLPAKISSDLERLGVFQSEGYAIEMAGLAVSAYDAAADQELETLEIALNGAMARIGVALEPGTLG